ncbi:MAG: hypothetical protein ACE5F1_17965, partial [Planctomycetota bacterium]
IFVSQPPLYLVEKGKKQVYVHSEEKLATTLFNLSADSFSLRIDGIAYSGSKLRDVVKVLNNIKQELRYQSKHAFGVSELVGIRAQMREWPTHCLLLRSEAANKAARAIGYPVRGAQKDNGSRTASMFIAGGEEELDKIIKQLTQEVADLRVSVLGDGVESSDLVIASIHLSQKFQGLIEEAEGLGLPIQLFDEACLGEGLDRSGDSKSVPALAVAVGSEITEVPTLGRALEVLFKSGRKDSTVKRFKGLGEMEPEQLWESTMDPDSRILYKVQLADAVTADQLFTILMGSVVEPRRKFIEKHALEVTNLDV